MKGYVIEKQLGHAILRSDKPVSEQFGELTPEYEKMAKKSERLKYVRTKLLEAIPHLAEQGDEIVAAAAVIIELEIFDEAVKEAQKGVAVIIDGNVILQQADVSMEAMIGYHFARMIIRYDRVSSIIDEVRRRIEEEKQAEKTRASVEQIVEGRLHEPSGQDMFQVDPVLPKIKPVRSEGDPETRDFTVN